MANFREIHFVLQKRGNPQNKHFGVQKTCTEWCETMDDWITARFPTIFPEIYWVNTLQRTEKCQIHGNFFDKEMESLDDHGCSKNEMLLMKKVDLLELPIQTQDHTSLCRAQGKIVW